MFTQDVAASSKINLLDQGKPWRAGVCEAVNDVGASLSVGVAGATVVQYGFSEITLNIELALICAAILGTKLGDVLTRRRHG